MRLILDECQKMMDECKKLPRDIAISAFREKLHTFANKHNIDPDALYKLYFNWLKKGNK